MTQGHFDETEQMARQAIERWVPSGFHCTHHVPLLISLVELGRSREAWSLLDEVVGGHPVEMTLGTILPDGSRILAPRLCCPCGLAEVCWRLGDRERAGPLYESLLPYAGDYAPAVGVCARYLGLLV